MRLPSQQQGVALLLLLFLLAAVGSSLLLRELKSREQSALRQQRSAEALLTARAALVAYSLTQPNAAGVPLQLPCPYLSTSLGEGIAASSCAHGEVGRLPWRTLGIQNPLDGWGETLWYTRDSNFRAPASGRLLNSDLRATLQVYQNDGTTLATAAGDEAAAILFAPGPGIYGQDRSNLWNAAAFLEARAGRNNATAGGPYIQGSLDASFNDQLLIISASDWLDRLKQRLASEIKLALESYRSSHGYYPAPARISDARCSDNRQNSGSSTDWCPSVVGECRGILPQTDETYAAINYPTWFRNNLWHRAVYYTVGGTASCGVLTVQRSGQADSHPSVLFFLPGTPQANIARIAATQTTSSVVSTNLSDYLEDAANQDGWGGAADDAYVWPSAGSNDRLFSIP
ncbi:hypothetical protein [Chitinibacter tainanensis]|uniref:hypothetical protein n=1 Tax=Chitinibacter tainanensis TaxID=230667 RepID=UPI000424B66F|nr:hypothetical protein [Chitinibacter tainanensis]